MNKTPPSWNKTIEVPNFGECSASFMWLDHGIGAYECHGFRGNQTAYAAELTNIKNSKGNDIYELLSEDEIRKIEDAATEDYRSSREE